jgi:alkylation response protein AidB-like acyl-CoA dehydrogenase
MTAHNVATATEPSTSAEADLAAFRLRAKKWLADNVPRTDATDRRQQNRFDRDAELEAVKRARTIQSGLFDAGLAGLTWPKEYGGQGLTPEYQRIFIEEAAGYQMGTNFFNIAFGMVGPTIAQLGTEAQRSAYLPRMLRGENTWCQLFSEPGAGSDVASLQTRAVRDGDEWVIRGQKVWTSGAHRADYGALLARTDSDLPKHQGLTMFILDMKSPGVTVRPLRQITGEAQFNEVFFDDVRLPLTNVIGEVNGGWHAAVTMLMNERVAIGSAGGGNDITAGSYARLLESARAQGQTGDPLVRQQLTRVYSLFRILGFVRQRTQDAIKAGRTPGPEGSIAKLLSAELLRSTTDTGTLIAGPSAQAWDPGHPDGDGWARASMFPFVITIGGGTNEIQRNIVGERVLGLPKEPQVDRDTPFIELKVGTQKV